MNDVTRPFCNHEDPKHPGRTCTKEPGHEGRHRYPPREKQEAPLSRSLVTIHAGLSLRATRRILDALGEALEDQGILFLGSNAAGDIVLWSGPDTEAKTPTE